MSSKFWALILFAIAQTNAIEHHSNLSYSQQRIRILPELNIQPQEPLPQIIFLHIPKTAGTNVDNMAQAVNGKEHYLRLTVPRTSRSPVHIVDGWIGGWERLAIDPHLLDHVSDAIFLTGHFPYGLHQYLSPSTKYVTLVRHPLARELSTANFAYQRGYMQAGEFASYLEQAIDNPQVRLIAGKDAMTGPCTEETFHLAIQHIENDFLLAAPSEEIDSFLQLLATIQHWGPLAYAPMQITKEKIADSLDPKLEETLLQKHAWDVRLYKWVKQRWESYKQKIILGIKTYPLDQPILTLMPEHLSSQAPQWLKASEIKAHNTVHSEQDTLELTQ